MRRGESQIIRYATTADGIRLAWAEAGAGPPLVKVSNWLTHLEYDWESPVWHHWIHFLAANYRFIRYDERGSGMSERDPPEMGFDLRVGDLETVVRASRPREPFALLAMSQGASIAVAYAVAHPEAVSHLVIYGGYVRGWARRGDEASRRMYEAMLELIRLGWGRENATFRQLFTSRFIPGGTAEQLQWFNALCRRSATPQGAARLLQTRGEVDVSELLPRVRVPTLVLHARDDEVTPIGEGQLFAAGIPGARFVELESRNHVLLEDEPAWRRFQEEVLAFTGRAGAAQGGGEDPAFAVLSRREREILALLCEGEANARIAARLFISEKTVRNHVSAIFDKLGVHTRTQAVVRAHEGRFSP